MVQPSLARPHNPLLVLLSLLALYFIWGSTYLAIHYAVQGFPPFLGSAIRFLLAGGTLYVFLRGRGMPTPTPAEWGGAARVGILLMGGGMGGVMLASSLGVASSLTAIFPAATPLLVVLFSGLWGRWPHRTEWVGLLVGFAGVVLLSLEGSLRSNPVATLILACAPLCWAFGTAWSRHLPLPSGLMTSATQMLSGGLFLLGLSLVMGERMIQMPGLGAILALLYLTVFGSLVAYSAFTYLLDTVRPALATSYAYVNPVVAVLLGVFIAHEKLDIYTFIALPIILLGVALVAVVRK
ncbi:drug/metabolite exporter YedA [Meiothermus hypogaeus]|uniref:Drug/metabolite exporter YedA n=2 Tax=Meiothermus hypogaeus TaxID=884155 RepID=A0A511R627_9DEIN|nr:drug/metabolite exporter YedA [Meiothermus hypogaeus]RIH74533.1 putative inner membrane transporter YedA [Meiothermus hypogaeus]GEM85035.1 drug/metabolite exporter YedA [Meiothermus hypogaeus NBRC 106114]GIW36654.1 MAG: drug/metabolite exporter YedA [Meiothermus sp.]